MRPILNCGLKALRGISNLENVSAYTLIQLANDNGIKFYLCKVKQDELPLVKRPAILHANNHFVLAEQDKALPQEEYTGWVLTTKPLGLPMSYSLAKTIVGAKKGGFARTILPTVIGVVSNIVLPGSGLITGAIANIGMDQYAKSNHPEQLGKAGNPMDIIGAGLAGAASGAASQGAISGFKAAGAGFGSKLAGAVGGAVTGVTHPIASNPLFGSNPSALFGGGNLAGGVSSFGGGKNLAPYGGASSSQISQAVGNISPGNTMSAVGNIGGSLKLSPMSMAGGAGGQTGGGGNPLDSIFGGDMGKTLLKTGIGALAGSFKPPQPEGIENYDTMANYDKAKRYMGENSSIPPATQQQLSKYLNMSIPDLKNELMSPGASNRAMLELDKKYEQELTNVQRAAANSGQDINTSSDARKQYNEVNRQWAEAKANLQGELEQAAQNQAVEIHMWALKQSIANGQTDMNSAMELAKLMGRDNELNNAIATDNYNAFQEIIGQLLAMGEQGGQQGSQYGGQQSQLTSTMRA